MADTASFAGRLVRVFLVLALIYVLTLIGLGWAERRAEAAEAVAWEAAPLQLEDWGGTGGHEPRLVADPARAAGDSSG